MADTQTKPPGPSTSTTEALRQRGARIMEEEAKKQEMERDHRRSTVAYGETRGLYPQLKDPGMNLYNRSSWEDASFAELQRAREWIAIVSERNPVVHAEEPIKGNYLEERAWGLSAEAAKRANQEGLPPDAKNFFLRQEGVGPQDPGWDDLEKYESIGPFQNTGGGDAPRGPKLYIDFYRKKRK